MLELTAAKNKSKIKKLKKFYMFISYLPNGHEFFFKSLDS